MNIKKRHNIKKIILGVFLLFIVGFLSYLLYAKLNHKPPFSLSSPDPGVHVINQEKSDAEKAQTQVLKNDPSQKTVNNQNDTPTTPSTDTTTGKQNVNVLLSFAAIRNGTVSAGGSAMNVVEEGGSCTYVFAKDGVEIKKTTSTMQNPTSTSCATTQFPASELTPGVWTVKLTYSSSASSGVSNTKELTR